MHNGLLLSPHVDRLFDRGLVTFDEDGQVSIANAETAAIWQAWGLSPSMRISAMNERERVYMKHHRAHVYRG